MGCRTVEEAQRREDPYINRDTKINEVIAYTIIEVGRGFHDDAAVVEVDIKLIRLGIIVTYAREVAFYAHEGSRHFLHLVNPVFRFVLHVVHGIHTFPELIREPLSVFCRIHQVCVLAVRNEVRLQNATHEEVVVLALNVHLEGECGRSGEIERTESVKSFAYTFHVGTLTFNLVIHLGQVVATKFAVELGLLSDGKHVNAVVVERGQLHQCLIAVFHQHELFSGTFGNLFAEVKIQKTVVGAEAGEDILADEPCVGVIGRQLDASVAVHQLDAIRILDVVRVQAEGQTGEIESNLAQS